MSVYEYYCDVTRFTAHLFWGLMWCQLGLTLIACVSPVCNAFTVAPNYSINDLLNHPLLDYYAWVAPVSGLSHGSVSTVFTEGGRVLKLGKGKSTTSGSLNGLWPPVPFCLFTKRSSMSSGSVREISSPGKQRKNNLINNWEQYWFSTAYLGLLVACRDGHDFYLPFFLRQEWQEKSVNLENNCQGGPMVEFFFQTTNQQ